jgi:hypothetical protein
VQDQGLEIELTEWSAQHIHIALRIWLQGLILWVVSISPFEPFLNVV